MITDWKLGDIKNSKGTLLGTNDAFVTKTDEDQDIYIETDGSDDSGDGSSGNPYLTLQHAISQTPDLINTNVNFRLGLGTFEGESALFKLNGTGEDYNYIRIIGTRVILQEQVTATSTSGNTLTVTDAGWTVDEFKGKMFVPVGGRGFENGEFFSYPMMVISNTADTLTFQSPYIYIFYNGTTEFVIYEPGTILSNDTDKVLNISGNLTSTKVNIWDCEIGGGHYFYTVYISYAETEIMGCYFNRKSDEAGAILVNDGKLKVYGCEFEGAEGYTQGGIHVSGMGYFESRYSYYHDFYSAGGNRQAIYCNNGNGVCYSDYFEDNTYCVRALRDSSVDLSTSCALIGSAYALYAQRGGIIDGFECVGSGNDYIARVADGGVVLVDETNVGYTIAIEFIDSAGGLCIHEDNNYAVTKKYELVYEANSVDVPVTELETYESGRMYINSSDECERTLPSAEAGLAYEFMIGSDNEFKINANTGDRIIVDGISGSLAGEISSSRQGDFIRLVAIDDTNWVAVKSRGTWVVNQKVQSLSANHTATIQESGKTFLNSAVVEIDLPSLSDALGCEYTFIVGSANYLRMNLDGTDTARYLAQSSAAGGYFRSATQGDVCKVIATASEWVVISLDGTFTFDS